MSDLGEGRVTLPLIRALRSDGRPHRERIAAFLRRRDLSGEEKDGLLELLSTTGALDYTSAKAREFSERAVSLLGRFPDSGPRRALAALARFVLGRDR
jgi:octaprenyl-diphosphate synthase